LEKSPVPPAFGGQPREPKDYRLQQFPTLPKVEMMGRGAPATGGAGRPTGGMPAPGGVAGGGGPGSSIFPFWPEPKSAPPSALPGGGAPGAAPDPTPAVPVRQKSADTGERIVKIDIDEYRHDGTPPRPGVGGAPAPASYPPTLGASGGAVADHPHPATPCPDANVARQFAETRARVLSWQMLETLARQRAATPDEVKQSIDRATKGDGWNPKLGAQVPPLLVTLEDAHAYFRIEQTVPTIPPLVVREYAAPRPGFDPQAETPDTVLWQPVIVLPADGKAKIPFHLGNAKGGYQVIVAGHTLDGRIGAVRRVIPVARPESTDAAATPGPPAPVPPPAP
jgi:hypothetical protein